MSDTIEFTIPMGNDKEGFFGRECPDEECLGYFKIELGTGLEGDELSCHCPYCGYVGSHNTFWTQDQLKYANSIAMREIHQQVSNVINDAFPPVKPRRGDIIGITINVNPGKPLPLYRYREKQLETIVVCSECGLRYAVYGVFGYCPDCGSHNSLQILKANLDLVQKELVLSETVDSILGERLVSDALENVVSAFDAFGRELFSVNDDLCPVVGATSSISCQNIDKLKSRIEELFDIELSNPFSKEEWRHLVIAFQKRHLISHKMGVVDQAYINATGDHSAVVGRKIQLDSAEVQEILSLVHRLGEYCYKALRQKRKP